ncbi:S8/S53 family peptidase [Microvirga terrestris]|uniref:S8/S53 family peptidase n=1 Tax=Microvirga terrestris TaxID=2791024 RepID=UPI001AED425E|nr:S8/S53 family peptidase [Microvirga terrestris]
MPLANVAYEFLGPTSGGVKLNSWLNSDDVRKLCEGAEKLDPLLSTTRSYSSLFDFDTDAVEAQKIYTGLVDPAPKATIHLLDTKLWPLPSLFPAFGVSPSPIGSKCKWSFDRALHHANHMASIIASQGKGTGFEGVAPGIKLRSFDIFDSKNNPGGAPMHVYVEENTYYKPSGVFLIPNTRTLGSGGDLPSKDWRFRDLLAYTLRNKGGFQRPLVVAAAGQQDTSTEAVSLVSIDSKTNMFPQNLGDLPNIIVVTACTDCTKKSATIHPGANHSSESDWKYVHVAAPGGVPIPAWTSPDTLGAAYGTSQSAAFVAGIAANMITRFPEVYAHNGVLKYRIQSCSWPLPFYRISGAENEDIGKIATGVVDPAVCMLNPSKTWVKDDSGWKPVEFRRWLPVPFSTPLNQILRVMRTGDAPSAEWTFYTMREDDGGANLQVDRGLGQVRRISLPSISTGFGIELCDGTVVKLLDGVKDIFMPSYREACQ